MALSREAQQVIADLDEYVLGEIKALGLEVAANLIEATPVDTGWARANWIPSVNVPWDGVDGGRGSVSAAAQSTGMAQLATIASLPDYVYVSNNVPYIERLNGGHSQQAPAGFVDIAIDQAIATIGSGIWSRA